MYACSLGSDFDESFTRRKLHLLVLLIFFVSTARFPMLLGRQDWGGTLNRRICALFPWNQRTFRSLHGTYCLLSWLNTSVVLLLIIWVLSNIIGGTIQESATSLIEETSSISIAILHSFRCLTRFCIFELFEIFFSILSSFYDLLIESIFLRIIVIRLLSLTILHRAVHVFLIFLIVICFFYDCWLLRF